MSHVEHRERGPVSVSCAVVTISDTRTAETDTGGRTIRELLEQGGHRVCSQRIVKDEPGQIRQHLAELVKDAACEAILMTGGTGIAARDQTYETVSGLLEKRLDGFGELYRICQVHIKEIGNYLGQSGKVDWPAVAAALQEVHYKGWLILETPPPNHDIVKDTQKNLEYVRSTFATVG